MNNNNNNKSTDYSEPYLKGKYDNILTPILKMYKEDPRMVQVERGYINLKTISNECSNVISRFVEEVKPIIDTIQITNQRQAFLEEKEKEISQKEEKLSEREVSLNKRENNLKEREEKLSHTIDVLCDLCDLSRKQKSLKEKEDILENSINELLQLKDEANKNKESSQHE
jgi:chromosome segregation ATPase